MAKSANSDADLYKESANEWKQIADYQSKKAKASAKFDARWQSEYMKLRASEGKTPVQRVLSTAFGSQKIRAKGIASGMTDDKIKKYIVGLGDDSARMYTEYYRRKAIKSEIGG